MKLYNAYFGTDVSENWAKEQHIKHVKPIDSIEERKAMEELEVKTPGEEWRIRTWLMELVTISVVRSREKNGQKKDTDKGTRMKDTDTDIPEVEG